MSTCNLHNLCDFMSTTIVDCDFGVGLQITNDSLKIFVKKMAEIRKHKIILDIDNEYLLCDESNPPTKSEMDQFFKKYRTLNQKELETAFHISNHDFSEILNQMVSCVGCRRSSEAFYKQLITCECVKSPFYPICIDKSGAMTLAKDRMKQAFLCSLFYRPSVKMQNLLESLNKCKPGRRCSVHSLDSQRLRCINSCNDVWDYLNGKFQDSSVCIEAKTLMETIEQYAERHRFCTDCKAKVIHAYHLLLGEADASKTLGFIPQLYEGIKFVKEDRFLHVSCKVDYFDRLIANAATGDLLGGGHQERHAKTVEMAQQEVLTCLGICIYERLHRIQSRCREQQQTCEIIMCVAIQAFKRSFDRAIEKKLGKSQLEILCEAFDQSEIAEQQRKSLRKLKKKKKKERKMEDAVKEEDTAATSQCNSSPDSTPLKVVEKSDSEDVLTNAFVAVPGKSKKGKNKSKCKTDGKLEVSKNPQSKSSSNSKEGSFINADSNFTTKTISSSVIPNKTLTNKYNPKDAHTFGGSLQTAFSKDAKPGSSQSSDIKVQDGSGDGGKGTYVSPLARQSNPCNNLEDSDTSSSSGLSDNEQDFLPDVDKSILQSTIWNILRQKQRGKILGDFANYMGVQKDDRVEEKCGGDSVPSAGVVSASTENKENTGDRKERVPRQGGMSKSRQTRSTKKYKGKNRH